MEIWDIYDSEKKPTGRTMIRDDWHMEPGEYHLTVLGVICRRDGRYLITQRKMDKPWAPGHWEIPGGGVNAGETSEEAIVRELKEETGLDVSEAEGGLALTYKRENPEEKNNYFVDVYRFVMDFEESDVRVQEEEVEGFAVVDAGQIRSLAEQGIFLHYDSIRKVFEL
jgi:mutator protein MutT